jgi:hypothetical protein
MTPSSATTLPAEDAELPFTLTGPDGRPYASDRRGTLGGHRRSKLYGRLDCRTARRAIARGGYVRDRVFFADEPTARAAGYRPCAVCLPEQYAMWSTRRDQRPVSASTHG